MTNIDKQLDHIRLLISSGEIEEALDLLDNLTTEFSDFHNDVLLQKFRYKSTLIDHQKGMITRDEFRVELNRILSFVLGMVDKLEPKLTIRDVPVEQPPILG